MSVTAATFKPRNSRIGIRIRRTHRAATSNISILVHSLIRVILIFPHRKAMNGAPTVFLLSRKSGRDTWGAPQSQQIVAD